MTAQWKEEKSALEDVRRVRTRLEETRVKAEQAEQAGDYNRAAELKYGISPEREKKLKVHEDNLKHNAGATLLKEVVDSDEIAVVVWRWSGVPVTKPFEGERE